MSRFPIFATVLLLTGCASVRTAQVGPRQPIPRNITTADAMTDAVWNLIPKDTPIEDARSSMESTGFLCYREEPSSFSRRMKQWNDVWFADNGNPGPYWKDESGQSYLYCGRVETAGFLVSREWKVTLVHRDGKVADVRVNQELTGT